MIGRDKAKDMQELQQMMHYWGGDAFHKLLMDTLANAQTECEDNGWQDAADTYAVMRQKLEGDL